MNRIGSVVQRDGAPFPLAVVRVVEDWGFPSVDVVSPPGRLWAGDDSPPPMVELSIDVRRVGAVPTPSSLLQVLPEGDNWSAHTRRSLARLAAYFLLCEDPQRRLDARAVNTLAHQVSLVRHVLDSGHLTRVLIADEVGLGKTVEVGLILQELLQRTPGLRVLYLAPARLVSNVRVEFDRLGLGFRQWTATDADARLTDLLILASIHRAVHRNHFDALVNTPLWDVIVVDECHHLTDWADGGGDPTQKYRLVAQLVGRLKSDGRLLLLSGTPHQGHPHRFENLLELLRTQEESRDALRGRVIYRTKEDVTDWDNNPLFPGRQVNTPLVVDLGDQYRTWIQHIHDFYSPPREDDAPESRRRAAGWRCAQALQWAASSPQAGLGYLVRQAIRAGWDLSGLGLRDAIAALRPYRAGPANESVEALFQRLVREVSRQRTEADLDDIEDDVDLDAAELERNALAGLLREGLLVLRQAADAKWELVRRCVLEKAAGEKIVLFAQPIETVLALAGYLERITGRKPALILGGQTDAERTAQVAMFRRPDGPRYLVSSKAGGEGINLQVARRLVHLDVPWNPMDMEQRVGRVHRFGSRQTIIVDTVVVKDSREADAYHVAREKLRMITSTLVEPARFEAVFARVMCLVSPQDLVQVIANEVRVPLTHADQERIAELVQQGFHCWNRFHQNYSEQQRQILQQDAGLANWDDLASLLREHEGATTREGYTAQRFTWVDGQSEPIEEQARVLDLWGESFACGDYAGTPVTGRHGERAAQLGLNLPRVTQTLRRLVFPSQSTGAAHLRWPEGRPLPQGMSLPFGVLVYLRQTVRNDLQRGFAEHSLSLRCYAISPTGQVSHLEGLDKGALLRGLFLGTVRVRPETESDLTGQLCRLEEELCESLRRPSDDDQERRLRHGVSPLLAAIVTR